MSPQPLELHARTPLIESRALTEALGLPGCRVWLKLENSQPTGCFKIRGIGHFVRRAAERGCKKVVSSSGGNAGLAAAYAASRLGLACTVVVPETTPAEMRARIAREGADVLVHGAVWREAHARAETLALADAGAVLVHPYDHPDVWAGNATLVDEVLAAGVTPDAVVCAVGGGGLLSGVADGLRRAGLAGRTRLFAAETAGANCLAAALTAGRPVALERIASAATSLGASQICQAAWEAAAEFALTSVVCSDAEAARASLAFLGEHHALTELACGAALSAVYDRRIALHQLPACGVDGGPVEIVLVVCGGRNVSVQQLVELAA